MSADILRYSESEEFFPGIFVNEYKDLMSSQCLLSEKPGSLVL